MQYHAYDMHATPCVQQAQSSHAREKTAFKKALTAEQPQNRPAMKALSNSAAAVFPGLSPVQRDFMIGIIMRSDTSRTAKRTRESHDVVMKSIWSGQSGGDNVPHRSPSIAPICDAAMAVT